ncbi:MAG: hypothetical protein DPW18_18625 [Chloroflexi bacterium]|nr:hypothetical protein [Chloroflexota bacterium]MDL1941452.1 hypothetical protein [Chloroflexi bacterium CFX2]
MNFQPPSKSLTRRDYQFIALVSFLFLAVSTGLVFANLSLPRGGGDFLVHWAGARGFLFERVDPYSGEIPARVQQLVYEDSAGAGGEPYILDSPFHLLPFYYPFALLSDPQVARAIYAMLLEWALIGLALLSLRLTGWEAPRWFAVLFFLFCVLNFYTFRAVLEASPVLLLGLIYAGMLLAHQTGQDELLGALMAVSVYYWEVGLPFLLMVAWRSYNEGRVRVLAGFFMLSFVLLAVSFLTYPNWLIPYLRAGMNNLRADFGFSTFASLELILPSYGRILAWAVAVVLVAALGYEWNALQTADDRRFYWTACLALASAPLLGFRTEMEHLAVLVIPLALVFAIIYDRWKRAGAVFTVLLLLIVFGLPWAAYFLALPRYGEMTFLFLPLFTVIGLYWIRWWALRPPRVWADLASQQA